MRKKERSLEPFRSENRVLSDFPNAAMFDRECLCVQD